MIEYYDGTVFNAGCEAIVNTINTDGFMGKGIALEFALRYDGFEEAYKHGCDNGDIHINKVYYHSIGEECIVCFPTKMHFQFPSKLEWIENGLKDFVSTYRKAGIHSAAFPRLGCANGGLKWEAVKPIMEKYLEPLDISVVICLDSNERAGGKEREMVEAFNILGIGIVSESVRLTKMQQDFLEKAKPIKRFREIGDIQGIGVETYRRLFKYFYGNEGLQMTFNDIIHN